MNKDYTDITLVVDRSGSMQSCKDDAEGGINSLIEEQKKQPGKCCLTLVQFDTKYEFVHNGVDIQSVEKYSLYPRGGTALLDAVGRAINETGERLANMPEEERPGLVIFVITTDGHENASFEFTRQQIKEMIELQQDTYKWQFTFLGANQDAFAEGATIGISNVGTANVASDKFDKAYLATSAKLGRMRSAVACGQSVDNSYTSAELKSMQ